MTLRSKMICCGLAVFAGANIFLAERSSAGEKRAYQLDESGFRQAATQADCNFSVDPDRFLQASARHRAVVSSTTADLGNKLGGRAREMAATANSTRRVPISRKNFIDSFIFDKLEEDDIPYAGLSTDAEFLRRVILELTGRIPSSSDVVKFLADTSADKRDKLVDALIASPEFVDRWTMFYGDLFRNAQNLPSNRARRNQSRNAYFTYIRDFVATSKPYNLVAKELIGAVAADSVADGSAGYMLAGSVAMGPAQDNFDVLAVETGRIFLGISSFDCLLCHNGQGHLNSVSVWGTAATRMDGWKMSAYFARHTVAQSTDAQGVVHFAVAENSARSDYQLNTTSGNRTPRQPVGTQKTVAPEYIFSHQAVSKSSNYRVVLGEQLTADLQFARAAVNYLWAEMMGVGIVDPPDQFDLARLDPRNPPSAPWAVQPSHPELLTALANEFIRSNYNIRTILTLIAKSNAYQLSSRFDSEWQEGYIPYFARKFVRRLSAEAIHDAVTKATGLLPSYTVNSMPGTFQWAMQLPDPTNEPSNSNASQQFLNAFLRGNRDTALRSSEGSILQALMLMNNTFVGNRVHNSNTGSLVNRLIASKTTDADVIDQLYLSTLGRIPTNDERTIALKTLSTPSTRNKAIEDLQWALINKVDFIYNY